MPIYAYRCADCGHAQDVLQKISDPLLTICPSCGRSNFQKQLTAAGFQLKGSGWYVTDFREGNKGKPGEAKAEEKDGGLGAKEASKGDDKAGAPAESKSGDGKSASEATSSGSVANDVKAGSASPAASSTPAAATAVSKSPAAAPVAAPRSGS